MQSSAAPTQFLQSPLQVSPAAFGQLPGQCLAAWLHLQRSQEPGQLHLFFPPALADQRLGPLHAAALAVADAQDVNSLSVLRETQVFGIQVPDAHLVGRDLIVCMQPGRSNLVLESLERLLATSLVTDLSPFGKRNANDWFLASFLLELFNNSNRCR